MRYRVLLLCLIMSGFAGLAYQLLWVRLLSVSFGSTTASFATVLAVFFSGLALGSWLAARHLGRIGRPGRAYGLIEGFMGVVGIALYPVLVNLGSVFAAIDPGPGILGGLLRALVSAPLLLIPTILMGMTLPLLCKAMIVEDASVGKGTGLIYGYNTLGACLGAFLITYILLPQLGVFKATLVTVIVNFLVMAVTLFVVRDERAGGFYKERAVSQPDAAGAEHRKYVLLSFVITFLSGFSFIAVEIVWSRLFSTILSGTIYGIGSVLIAILLGIAVGSWIAALSARAGLKPLSTLTVSLVVFAVGVIGILRGIEPVAYFIKFVAETAHNAKFSVYYELGAVLLVLLIPSAAIGASLPLLVQVVEKTASGTGRTLGRLYAVNTVGSISGSLVTGFFLLPVLGSETASYLVLMMLAVAVVFAAFAAWVAGQRIVAIPAVLGCALMLTFDGYDRQAVTLFAQGTSGLSYDLVRKTAREIADQTLYFSEGKNATVRITREKYMLGMTLNGLGQGGRNFLHPEFNLESTLVGYVGMPFLRETERAFVVGLGVGNTVHVLRDLGMRHTKVVELEPKVVEAVFEIFKDYGGFGPQVDIEINDARHSLLTHKARGGEPYNLIASMPAHPWVANAIFTKEFFELAKSNLTPDGIFVSWFGSSHAHISMTQTVTDSVTNAFASVFPNFAIFYVEETSSVFLVGSPAPLRFGMDKAEELTRHPRIAAHEVLKNPLFLPVRGQAWRTAGRPVENLSPVNSDDSAYAEVWAPIHSTEVYQRTLPEKIGALPWPSLEVLPEQAQLFSAALDRQFDLTSAALVRPRKKEWETAADSLLAAARPHLPELSYCTAVAKKHLLMIRFDDAQRILQSCPESPVTTSLRVLTKFLAEGQVEKLNGAAYSKELALVVLDRTLSDLPELEISQETIDDDPVAWLYWHAASEKSLDTETKAAFHEKISQELLKFRRHGVLFLAADLAGKHNIPGLQKIFMSASLALGQEKSFDVFGMAMSDWKGGRRQQAVEKLERVIDLNPRHQVALLYLLKAYREAPRPEEEVKVRRHLLSLGVSSKSIDAMIALEQKGGAGTFQEQVQ